MRAWGGGRISELVFKINVWKFELVLWKDITPTKKNPKRRHR